MPSYSAFGTYHILFSNKQYQIFQKDNTRRKFIVSTLIKFSNHWNFETIVFRKKNELLFTNVLSSDYRLKILYCKHFCKLIFKKNCKYYPGWKIQCYENWINKPLIIIFPVV